MQHRHDIDASGTTALVTIMLVLAVNQVVIKRTNDGLQPVFAAALRSAGAVAVILGWMCLRGQRLDLRPGKIWPGVLIGLVFSVEFLALFLALDLTTVTRVSVIFFSMPVWMALAAHVHLPGEGLTPLRSLGLALAFTGVAWAIIDRSGLRARCRSRAISPRWLGRSAGWGSRSSRGSRGWAGSAPRCSFSGR